MANNLEIEAQRQALVTSIRDAAQALRECANKTDTFANYLQNVFPVPQPYSAISFHHVQSPPLPTSAPDGPPVKRRPGRPKKADHDDDPTAPDDGGLNGDGKKRKRQTKEKKPRDPNAPKRPPSAYLLYQNHVRKDVQNANPNLPYGEILTYISKAWAQLSDNDKLPYNSATELAKAEYEKKKSAYEATLKSTEPLKSPETAASVPVHQDTSEDDEHEQFAPPPAIVTTAARIKSPPAVRPVLAVRGPQVVKPQEVSSEDGDEDEEMDEEEEADKELVPPPKKRARKSVLPAATKEKEKEKGKKEKERKERKEKKYRE